MDLHSQLTRQFNYSAWVLPAYILGLLSFCQLEQLRWFNLILLPLHKLKVKIFHRILFISEPTYVKRISLSQLWHLLYNLVFGLLAWSTVRMKYLWTPHILLVSTVGLIAVVHHGALILVLLLHRITLRLSHGTLGRPCVHNPKDSELSADCCHSCVISGHKRIKTFHCRVANFALLCLVVYWGVQTAVDINSRLSQLGEFYDPDTVDLMNWIMKNTDKKAIFTGSMQLMAAVKLCTGRPIANHPHYENAGLRERTRQLYQIYGRLPAEDVHSLLLKHSISYIIIENSICFAPSTGCAEKDIVDLDNQQWPDMWLANVTLAAGGQVNQAYFLDATTRASLRKPFVGSTRICVQLAVLSDGLSGGYVNFEHRKLLKYFKPVFHNPTFHVFKVIAFSR